MAYKRRYLALAREGETKAEKNTRDKQDYMTRGMHDAGYIRTAV